MGHGTIGNLWLLCPGRWTSAINFLDTADLYGCDENERLLGLAIRNRRAEVFLAIKFGNVLTQIRRAFSPRKKSPRRQGKVILFPTLADRIGESPGEIRTRERRRGCLKYYHREAA